MSYANVFRLILVVLAKLQTTPPASSADLQNSDPESGTYTVKTETYTVKPGDTLSNISQSKVGSPVYPKEGSLRRVLILNDSIKNPDRIYPKQQIKLRIEELMVPGATPLDSEASPPPAPAVPPEAPAAQAPLTAGEAEAPATAGLEAAPSPAPGTSVAKTGPRWNLAARAFYEPRYLSVEQTLRSTQDSFKMSGYIFSQVSLELEAVLWDLLQFEAGVSYFNAHNFAASFKRYAFSQASDVTWEPRAKFGVRIPVGEKMRLVPYVGYSSRSSPHFLLDSNTTLFLSLDEYRFGAFGLRWESDHAFGRLRADLSYLRPLSGSSTFDFVEKERRFEFRALYGRAIRESRWAWYAGISASNASAAFDILPDQWDLGARSYGLLFGIEGRIP